jgi:hypothetical protein
MLEQGHLQKATTIHAHLLGLMHHILYYLSTTQKKKGLGRKVVLKIFNILKNNIICYQGITIFKKLDSLS